MILLFALAIAPGLAICLLIYSRYQYKKEPLGTLVISFLLGMLATVPAFLIQSMQPDIRDDSGYHPIWEYAWFAYVIVAFSEEAGKFIILRLYAYPRKSFSEPFDGIVYAVMIGMGFATLENIEYVRRYGFETGIIRFFLAVPAHAAFAVLMGYYIGLGKFNPLRSTWLNGKGLLIAVLFHGSFDFFLFMEQNETVTRYVSTGLLSFGAFASFYIAVRLAIRALRLHTRLAQKEILGVDRFK